MEQNQKLLQNRNFLIGGLVVLLVIGYFLIQRQKDANPQTAEDQTSSENTNTNGGQSEIDNSQNTNSTSTSNETNPAPSSSAPSGNVSATGTLRPSDKPALGNLMLDSNRGKIYVRTNRDFSSLVGKQTSLDANGTINSFVFLGFGTGSSTGTIAGATKPTDTAAVGGGDTLPAGVRVSGTLVSSDNKSKGDFVINSGSGKIYLKSQHDYAALVGSDVELSANGTINNFTGAVLNKK